MATDLQAKLQRIERDLRLGVEISVSDAVFYLHTYVLNFAVNQRKSNERIAKNFKTMYANPNLLTKDLSDFPIDRLVDELQKKGVNSSLFGEFKGFSTTKFSVDDNAYGNLDWYIYENNGSSSIYIYHKKDTNNPTSYWTPIGNLNEKLIRDIIDGWWSRQFDPGTELTRAFEVVSAKIALRANKDLKNVEINDITKAGKILQVGADGNTLDFTDLPNTVNSDNVEAVFNGWLATPDPEYNTLSDIKKALILLNRYKDNLSSISVNKQDITDLKTFKTSATSDIQQMKTDIGKKVNITDITDALKQKANQTEFIAFGAKVIQNAVSLKSKLELDLSNIDSAANERLFKIADSTSAVFKESNGISSRTDLADTKSSLGIYKGNSYSAEIAIEGDIPKLIGSDASNSYSISFENLNKTKLLPDNPNAKFDSKADKDLTNIDPVVFKNKALSSGINFTKTAVMTGGVVRNYISDIKDAITNNRLVRFWQDKSTTKDIKTLKFEDLSLAALGSSSDYNGMAVYGNKAILSNRDISKFEMFDIDPNGILYNRSALDLSGLIGGSFWTGITIYKDKVFFINANPANWKTATIDASGNITNVQALDLTAGLIDTTNDGGDGGPWRAMTIFNNHAIFVNNDRSKWRKASIDSAGNLTGFAPLDLSGTLSSIQIGWHDISICGGKAYFVNSAETHWMRSDIDGSLNITNPEVLDMSSNLSGTQSAMFVYNNKAFYLGHGSTTSFRWSDAPYFIKHRYSSVVEVDTIDNKVYALESGKTVEISNVILSDDLRKLEIEIPVSKSILPVDSVVGGEVDARDVSVKIDKQTVLGALGLDSLDKNQLLTKNSDKITTISEGPNKEYKSLIRFLETTISPEFKAGIGVEKGDRLAAAYMTIDNNDNPGIYYRVGGSNKHGLINIENILLRDVSNIDNDKLRDKLQEIGLNTGIFGTFKGIHATPPVAPHTDLDWYINTGDHNIYIWHDNAWNNVGGSSNAVTKTAILNALNISEQQLVTLQDTLEYTVADRNKVNNLPTDTNAKFNDYQLQLTDAMKETLVLEVVKAWVNTANSDGGYAGLEASDPSKVKAGLAKLIKLQDTLLRLPTNLNATLTTKAEKDLSNVEKSSLISKLGISSSDWDIITRSKEYTQAEKDKIGFLPTNITTVLGGKLNDSSHRIGHTDSSSDTLVFRKNGEFAGQSYSYATGAYVGAFKGTSKWATVKMKDNTPMLYGNDGAVEYEIPFSNLDKTKYLPDNTNTELSGKALLNLTNVDVGTTNANKILGVNSTGGINYISNSDIVTGAMSNDATSTSVFNSLVQKGVAKTDLSNITSAAELRLMSANGAADDLIRIKENNGYYSLSSFYQGAFLGIVKEGLGELAGFKNLSGKAQIRYKDNDGVQTDIPIKELAGLRSYADTINTVVGNKANSSDVYSRTNLDGKFNDINGKLLDESSQPSTAVFRQNTGFTTQANVASNEAYIGIFNKGFGASSSKAIIRLGSNGPELVGKDGVSEYTISFSALSKVNSLPTGIGLTVNENKTDISNIKTEITGLKSVDDTQNAALNMFGYSGGDSGVRTFWANSDESNNNIASNLNGKWPVEKGGVSPNYHVASPSFRKVLVFQEKSDGTIAVKPFHPIINQFAGTWQGQWTTDGSETILGGNKLTQTQITDLTNLHNGVYAKQTAVDSVNTELTNLKIFANNLSTATTNALGNKAEKIYVDGEISKKAAKSLIQGTDFANFAALVSDSPQLIKAGDFVNIMSTSYDNALGVVLSKSSTEIKIHGFRTLRETTKTSAFFGEITIAPNGNLLTISGGKKTVKSDMSDVDDTALKNKLNAIGIHTTLFGAFKGVLDTEPATANELDWYLSKSDGAMHIYDQGHWQTVGGVSSITKETLLQKLNITDAQLNNVKSDHSQYLQQSSLNNYLNKNNASDANRIATADSNVSTMVFKKGTAFRSQSYIDTNGGYVGVFNDGQTRYSVVKLIKETVDGQVQNNPALLGKDDTGEVIVKFRDIKKAIDKANANATAIDGKQEKLNDNQLAVVNGGVFSPSDKSKLDSFGTTTDSSNRIFWAAHDDTNGQIGIKLSQLIRVGSQGGIQNPVPTINGSTNVYKYTVVQQQPDGAIAIKVFRPFARSAGGYTPQTGWEFERTLDLGGNVSVDKDTIKAALGINDLDLQSIKENQYELIDGTIFKNHHTLGWEYVVPNGMKIYKDIRFGAVDESEMNAPRIIKVNLNVGGWEDLATIDDGGYGSAVRFHLWGFHDVDGGITKLKVLDTGNVGGGYWPFTSDRITVKALASKSAESNLLINEQKIGGDITLDKASVMKALGITSISQEQLMSPSSNDTGAWINASGGYHTESSYTGGTFLGAVKDGYSVMAGFKFLNDVPNIRYRKSGGGITDLPIEDIAKKDLSNVTSHKLLDASSTEDIAVVRDKHDMRIQAATYSTGTAFWLKDDRNGNDTDYLGMNLINRAPKISYKKNGSSQRDIDLEKIYALSTKTLQTMTVTFEDDTTKAFDLLVPA